MPKLDQTKQHDRQQRRADGELDEGLAALRALEPTDDTKWSLIHASSQSERRKSVRALIVPVHIFGSNRSL